MKCDYGLRFPQLPVIEARAGREMNMRREPELRLAVGMRHMHMNARFLSREEKKPERAFAENGGRHEATVHRHNLADERCEKLSFP